MRRGSSRRSTAPSTAPAQRGERRPDRRALVPNATELVQVSFERSALPDGALASSTGSARTRNVGRGARGTYIAFVRMQQGRAIVRMPITTYGSPLSDADLQPLVAAATRTLNEALD